MLFLDTLKTDLNIGNVVDAISDGATVLRVHRDVTKLAMQLAASDGEKLREAGGLLFAPDFNTWLDIDSAEGPMGFYFHSKDTVKQGDCLLLMKRHGEVGTPAVVPCHLDLEAGRLVHGPSPRAISLYKKHGVPMEAPMLKTPAMTTAAIAMCETMTPVILAILALINSPKIVKKGFVDQAKFNKKRIAHGKYTYHPHHTVRLDVDKQTVKTVSGSGVGASKALHMVRAHLRLVRDHYVLVQPHWRGDPAIGMIRTTYEADRKNSRWKD